MTFHLGFVFQTKFAGKNRSSSICLLLGPANQLGRVTGPPSRPNIHPLKSGKNAHISVNMVPRNNLHKISFIVEVALIFSCGATLYPPLCVCLCVCMCDVPRFVCPPNMHLTLQLLLDSLCLFLYI